MLKQHQPALSPHSHALQVMHVLDIHTRQQPWAMHIPCIKRQYAWSACRVSGQCDTAGTHLHLDLHLQPDTQTTPDHCPDMLMSLGKHPDTLKSLGTCPGPWMTPKLLPDMLVVLGSCLDMQKKPGQCHGMQRDQRLHLDMGTVRRPHPDMQRQADMLRCMLMTTCQLIT